MDLILEAALASGLAAAGAAFLGLILPDLGRTAAIGFGALAGVVLLALPSALALSVGNFVSVLWFVPLMVWLAALLWMKRSDLGRPGANAALAALMVFLTALVVGAVSAPILTFDSWRFLEYGSSMFGDGHSIETLRQIFANYPLLLTTLEGTARYLGLPFASTSVAAVGVVAVAAGASLLIEDRSRYRTLVFPASVGAVLVVASSSYHLRVQLGYVNSHVLAAAFLSASAASIFAAERSLSGTGEISERTRAWLVAGSCCGIALSRVEGLLFVGLLLAVAMGVRRWSLGSMLVLGAGVAIPASWYIGLAVAGTTGDILSPARMLMLIAAGAAPLLLGLAFGKRVSWDWIPSLGLLGLGSAFLLLALSDMEGLAETATAMTLNLAVDGLWGGFWWVVLPLGAFALARLDRDVASWFLLTFGYVAMVVLLGALREFPYRVGWGDSGNRMMVHVAPVFVFLALTAFRSPEDPPHRSLQRMTGQGTPTATE